MKNDTSGGFIVGTEYARSGKEDIGGDTTWLALGARRQGTGDI